MMYRQWEITNVGFVAYDDIDWEINPQLRAIVQ